MYLYLCTIYISPFTSIVRYVLLCFSKNNMMLQSLSFSPCTINIIKTGPKAGQVKITSRGVLCSYNISKADKQPFSSRSKIERMVKEPPLILKAENDVADYCSTLEGDASYSCWRGYFELKDLEREVPKEEVEKLIIEAGGVKSLISCLHGISSMQQKKNETKGKTHVPNDEIKEVKHYHVPDGLPKTNDEVEEEEKSKMPDSPFTRLLRSKGKHPAWYTPAPDHETD